jgi:uncharacterized protein (TIGR03067 family)
MIGRQFHQFQIKGDNMRKIVMLSFIFIAALLAASVRSEEDKSDSATLQGKWKGEEVGGETKGTTYLIVTGKNFEFRGADTNDCYKGTFTLKEDAKPHQLHGKIMECPAPELVGKTSIVIYKFEKDTLTFAAHAPGKTKAPASFDAPETRQFLFKKE